MDRKNKRELKRKSSEGRLKQKRISKVHTVWTPEEDEILIEAFTTDDGKHWKSMVEELRDYGKTGSQCLHRWQKVLDPKLVKGSWTKEEDDLLVTLVETYGAKNWSVIATHLNGRIGKQCRERWYNHLDPTINKEPWSEEEDDLIVEYCLKYGGKWSELSKILVGRPSNAIKNHWNSTLKKRVYESGKKKDKKLKIKKEKRDDVNMELPSEEDSIVMPVPHYKREETPSSPYHHSVKSEPGASPASSSPLEACTSPISSAYSEFDCDLDMDSDPMSSDLVELPAHAPPMADFSASNSQLGELFGDSSLLHHHPIHSIDYHDELFFSGVHYNSFEAAPTTKTNVLDLSNVSIASHRHPQPRSISAGVPSHESSMFVQNWF